MKSRCGCQAWAEGFEAGSERGKGERGAGLRNRVLREGTYPRRGAVGSSPQPLQHPECQVRREPCFPFCLLLLLSFLPVLPALQTLQLVPKREPELVGPSA